MISFLLLTTDAADMSAKLIARGILDADGGAKDGFEYVEVGPIKLTEASEDEEGYTIPATYDSRRVYLCKFAHEMEADEIEGEDANDAEGNPRDMMLRTKIGKFVQSNGTRDDLPDGSRAWRIGTKFWISPDHSHLAVWQ
jgi:hypothetical protein